MRTELSPIESVEKQVREAITLSNKENPVLQSSANDENSALQNGAQNDIINNSSDSATVPNNEQHSISGDDINGSTNPELLGGRTISAAGGSGNGVRQQGENSRKISSFVGDGTSGQGNNNSALRAGDSGWFVRQSNQKGEVRNRFEESVRGKISRIAPSGFDTIGRKISNEIKERFKNTVFKDENGNLLSLYHWTQATFETFAKGEFGFHFGTLDAAHDRYTQSLEEDPNTQKGFYKEVYLNITNPYYIPFDAGVWSAEAIAYQLELEGIITKEQQEEFRQMEGYYDNTYDNPAAQTLREFLSENGYDGIIYENDSEDAGGISVIAFYPDQILTVAENGVLKPNNGVSEADLDNGPASFMPENGSDNSNNDSGNIDNDSGELGFREPDSKGIYRKSTDAETAEGILTGKRIDNKMRHINDIAKKLDGGMKIVWCEKNTDKLHGKNGKFVRETNTMYLAKDIGIAQMYHEVFKHEFVHRLESRKAYQSFSKYLFEKSKAFENYARAQLKVINPDKVYETRTDALEDLVEQYLYQVKNDNTIPFNIRQNFVWEDAKREVVADFVGETLFKGKQNRADMAQALSEFDSEYMNDDITQKTVEGFFDAVNKDEGNLDLFGEMATNNRNLLQKVIDVIMDFINNLKNVPQNKSLVEDLEYIEQRLSRVYASKDTKKAASQSGGVQYSWKNDAKGNKYWHIDTEKDIFKNLKTPRQLEKAAFNYIIGMRDTNVVVDAIDGKKMSFIRLSAEEFTNSEESKSLFANDPVMFAQKMRLIPSIEDLASNANINWWSPDQKNHKLFKERGFENFRGRVGIDNVVFNFVIRSGKAKFGDVFYDINLEVDHILPHANSASEITESTSSDINVPQKVPSVKNNISEAGEEYSDISDTKEQFSSGSPSQKARENLKKYENGEMSREEYLAATDELFGEANQGFGIIPQGENAQAPIATPKAVAEDKPTERVFLKYTIHFFTTCLIYIKRGVKNESNCKTYGI